MTTPAASGNGLRWVPLALLPIVAYAVTRTEPAWMVMWALAVAVFAGCKWLSFVGVIPPPVASARALAYLFLWPGMDAEGFILPAYRRTPSGREWLFAAAKTGAGAALLWSAVRFVPAGQSLLAGWIGMLGLVFLMHFGAFHLLALGWQMAGFGAKPIMDRPLAARSLAEFWSARWNRGFSDLAHRFIFVPTRRHVGIAGATSAVFLTSGLIHELVISVPARAGFGLPTLYFAFQGAGVLLERSRWGRRIGLRRGWAGRLYALLLVALPAFWLFHPPFVARVMIPFLEAIGAK